jgi:predicted dehydrogenase
VDAATLCTPIGLHYEQGLAAIRAGKHVHFNKTMCTTADEEPSVSLERPEDRIPHVTGAHEKMREKHVFADIMQLVGWVRDGRPSIMTAEHARHVVEILDAAYIPASGARLCRAVA